MSVPKRQQLTQPCRTDWKEGAQLACRKVSERGKVASNVNLAEPWSINAVDPPAAAMLLPQDLGSGKRRDQQNGRIFDFCCSFIAADIGLMVENIRNLSRYGQRVSGRGVSRIWLAVLFFEKRLQASVACCAHRLPSRAIGLTSAQRCRLSGGRADALASLPDYRIRLASISHQAMSLDRIETNEAAIKQDRMSASVMLADERLPSHTQEKRIDSCPELHALSQASQVPASLHLPGQSSPMRGRER
jgi:hypothetical protein